MPTPHGENFEIYTHRLPDDLLQPLTVDKVAKALTSTDPSLPITIALNNRIANCIDFNEALVIQFLEDWREIIRTDKKELLEQYLAARSTKEDNAFNEQRQKVMQEIIAGGVKPNGANATRETLMADIAMATDRKNKVDDVLANLETQKSTLQSEWKACNNDESHRCLNNILERSGIDPSNKELVKELRNALEAPSSIDILEKAGPKYIANLMDHREHAPVKEKQLEHIAKQITAKRHVIAHLKLNEVVLKSAAEKKQGKHLNPTEVLDRKKESHEVGQCLIDAAKEVAEMASNIEKKIVDLFLSRDEHQEQSKHLGEQLKRNGALLHKLESPPPSPRP